MSSCAKPNNIDLSAKSDKELISLISDSDTLLQLETLYSQAKDPLATFTEICPYYAALAEREGHDIALKQEGYKLLKEKLAVGENDAAANLARLIWASCPEMMDIIEFDCPEIFSFLTDRELVSFLVRQNLIDSESLNYSWSWHLYHSPSPAEALDTYARQHPAFAVLYARETCGSSLAEFGIPIVSERMASVAYGDHCQAVALAQLICAASPEAANALKEVPNPYQDMTDEELVQKIASHELISFFFHGPWHEPLSEKGFTYFGTVCPEFAILAHRDTLASALAEYGPTIAQKMRKSDIAQESLNGWAFMELVTYLNPNLQAELDEMIYP